MKVKHFVMLSMLLHYNRRVYDCTSSHMNDDDIDIRIVGTVLMSTGLSVCLASDYYMCEPFVFAFVYIHENMLCSC